MKVEAENPRKGDTTERHNKQIYVSRIPQGSSHIKAPSHPHRTVEGRVILFLSSTEEADSQLFKDPRGSLLKWKSMSFGILHFEVRVLSLWFGTRISNLCFLHSSFAIWHLLIHHQVRPWEPNPWGGGEGSSAPSSRCLSHRQSSPASSLAGSSQSLSRISPLLYSSQVGFS